jgi:hypothetical protein
VILESFLPPLLGKRVYNVHVRKTHDGSSRNILAAGHRSSTIPRAYTRKRELDTTLMLNRPAVQQVVVSLLRT